MHGQQSSIDVFGLDGPARRTADQAPQYLMLQDIKVVKARPDLPLAFQAGMLPSRLLLATSIAWSKTMLPSAPQSAGNDPDPQKILTFNSRLNAHIHIHVHIGGREAAGQAFRCRCLQCYSPQALAQLTLWQLCNVLIDALAYVLQEPAS